MQVLVPLLGGQPDITDMARALVTRAAQLGFSVTINEAGGVQVTPLPNAARAAQVLEDNDAFVGRRRKYSSTNWRGR
jgi:hypothetical protein